MSLEPAEESGGVLVSSVAKFIFALPDTFGEGLVADVSWPGV